jgi:hypothetical protein
MRRTFVMAAALVLLGGGGAAQAEPLRLDERRLGAVAAGTAGLLGPVNVAIGISNPTDVEVSPSTVIAAGIDADVTNQVGTGVAVGVTTALGVLASGVAAAGLSRVDAGLGSP